jgi:hypothetical protein
VGVTGTVAGPGLPPGTTFLLKVADRAFAKSYTATVGADARWIATIPSASIPDMALLTSHLAAFAPAGFATETAQQVFAAAALSSSAPLLAAPVSALH